MWGPTPQRPLKLRTSKTFDQLELRFGKFPHELPFEDIWSEAKWGRYKSFAQIISNGLAASNTEANPVLAACPYRDMGHHLGEANTMAAKQVPTAPRDPHGTDASQKIETQLMWGKTMISLETCLSACPAYSECRPLLILGSLNHTIFTVHNKRTSFLTIFHHGTGRLRWIQSRMINIRIICKNSESNQLLLRCVGKCKPSQASSEHWWNTSRERHGSEPWAHCVHDGYGRWTTAVMEGYM